MDDLTIRLRMDRSEAEKAAAAFHAAERRRQTETAKAQADAARQAAREQAAAAREAERVARDAARQQAAEARKAAQEQARLDNRVLSETEIRERAKQEIYRKTNQQRIQELTKAHRTEMDKARESEAAANRLMGSATAAVSSFAGQMVGLSSVSSVMNEVMAGFQRTRDAIFNSTEMMREFRESLLELAALKDRMGDTSAEAVDTLRVQARTGQKRQDVVAMQEAFLGIGEAAVTSGKATMDDVQEAMIRIGRLQAVQGADAGAYGNLGGLLLQTMPAGTKPEDIAKEAAAMYEIAQPGGFTTFGSAAGQFGKAMPYIQSGILSAREAMAMTSAFSIAEPDQAATRVDQLVRATIGAMGRDRRVAAPEGVDVQGTATYLQGIGAKGDMSPVEIARMIGQDVKRAQAAGGDDFNAFSYLQHQGFGNVEDLKAILGMSGLIDSGTWDKTFAGAITDPNLGKARLAEADARLADDPGLRARQAAAGQQMADLLPGMGREEIMQSNREAARSRILARNPNAGLRSIRDMGTSWSPSAWIEDFAVRGETSSMLMEFADREGIKYSPSIGLGGDRYLSDNEQFRVSQELANRGVNVQGEVNQKLAEAAEKMLEASKNMQQAARPTAAPALQSKPVMLPSRPM